MELEPNVDCTLSRNPADDQLGFCYLFLRNDSSLQYLPYKFLINWGGNPGAGRTKGEASGKLDPLYFPSPLFPPPPHNVYCTRFDILNITILITKAE